MVKRDPNLNPITYIEARFASEKRKKLKTSKRLTSTDTVFSQSYIKRFFNIRRK